MSQRHLNLDDLRTLNAPYLYFKQGIGTQI